MLAGAPALEERLANPKLDSFNQRLSARCYLEAFSRGETQDYIQSQISWAGGQGDQVFPEATCQVVFQATGGVVRLINQLCDHALLLCYVAGRKTIEPAGVEEAWADLQQLPTPSAAQSVGDPAGGGVIEFGALDDSTGGAGILPATSEAAMGPPSGAAPTATVFRVAQIEDEQSPPDDSEPAVQIHRIEQLLAEADDDFQPAGSIGPEVELCFEEAIHPFREEFEQEEVVSDRYAAAGRVEAASCRLATGAALAPPPAALQHAAAARQDAASTAPAWQDAASAEAAETNAGAAVELPPQPVPMARHEFRQLFARLRRG